MVTVHNSYAQYLSTLVKVPLYQNTENITLTDSQGYPVDYQVC